MVLLDGGVAAPRGWYHALSSVRFSVQGGESSTQCAVATLRFSRRHRCCSVSRRLRSLHLNPAWGGHDMPSTTTPWAVILAGGDGTRLRPLTQHLTGDARPKQFCRLFGGRT